MGSLILLVFKHRAAVKELLQMKEQPCRPSVHLAGEQEAEERRERPLSDVSQKMKEDANVKYIDQCSSTLNSSALAISIHWKHHLYQQLFLLIKIWPKSLPLIFAITLLTGLTLSSDFSMAEGSWLEIWEPVKQSTNELCCTEAKTHILDGKSNTFHCYKCEGHGLQIEPKSQYEHANSNLTLSQLVLALDDACLQRCWGFIIVRVFLTEQKQCCKVWTSTQCLFFITKINVSFPDGPLIDTAVCGESSIWAPQWFKPNCCSFISSVGHLNTLHGLKNLCADGSKKQKPMLTQQKRNEGRVGMFLF